MEEVHYLDYLQLKIFAPQTKTHNIFGVKNCEIRLPIDMNYIYIFHKVLFQLHRYMVIFLHTRFFKSSWAWLSEIAGADDGCLCIFRFVFCRNWVFFFGVWGTFCLQHGNTHALALKCHINRKCQEMNKKKIYDFELVIMSNFWNANLKDTLVWL